MNVARPDFMRDNRTMPAVPWRHHQRRHPVSGRNFGAILVAAASLVLSTTPVCAATTTLGITGARFTLNGRPAFLYGISYYGGLGAPTNLVSRDLEDLQRSGFNWLRVWATWSGFSNDVAAVDALGNGREPYLTRLKQLVADCDRRGLVVDVTLSRGDGRNGSPALPTFAAHQQAVSTLVAALKPWHNCYLDLANERNIRDARFASIAEISQLVTRAHTLDPELRVTASHGGDLNREELAEYLLTARVDFIAPHRPRDAGSAAQTEARTREYLAWMQTLGRVVPVHYQEPMRRGYADWNPGTDDFATDLRGAIAGGAAGWCFHNGSQRTGKRELPRRSFDLRNLRLFAQLDAVERQAIAQMQPVAVSAAGAEK